MKKRILFLLAFSFALCFCAQSQPVVNGVMQGSPKTFMVLPTTSAEVNSPTMWVRPSYGNNYNTYGNNEADNDANYTHAGGGTVGVFMGSGTNNYSHAMLTWNGIGDVPTDCNSCVVSSTTNYLPVFPFSWNSSELLQGTIQYEDSVVRVGFAGNQGNKSQRIEYTFIPDTLNPVLLFNNTFVLENKVTGGHDYCGNPRVRIEVLDASTNQPLDLGYYPSDYIENGNMHQGIQSYENHDWPYSRYYYIAAGAGQGSCFRAGWGDKYMMTPSAFVREPYSCPRQSACNAGSDVQDVLICPYEILAFNLMEQARSQTPVKLVVTVRACIYSAHWAYLNYTAKMVPGKIQVHQTADTVELSVPWGFDANTYHWKHGLNKDTCVMLTTNNQYKVKIPRNQLMPYYRCEMESQTGVPFVYEVRPHKSDITADFSATQQDSAQMTVFQFNDLSQILEITPDFSAFGIYVPADTVVEPASSLRWSWKKEGSAWTSFAQDEHNPVLALPTPDHYDSIRVKLEVEDPETGVQGSVEKTFYYGSNVGVGAYASEITLYPNPNIGKFVIQSGMAAMKEVCVYDLQGRLLRKVSADGQTTAIDIKGLPSGTYMVRIETDKGIVTKTVVKQ